MILKWPAPVIDVISRSFLSNKIVIKFLYQYLFRACQVILILLASILSLECQAAKSINIGIIIDGPMERQMLPLSAIKQEMTELTRDEFTVQFPEDKVIDGGWTLAGIQSAIEQLMNDPSVDLILANGLLASHQAAKNKILAKPVIATVIADRVVQELPYSAGHSGKHNYVYISDNRSVDDDLRRFHALIPFKHLVVPVDSSILQALPELKDTTIKIQNQLGFKLSIIPIYDNLQEVLERFPADCDAVYAPPIQRFHSDQIQAFANALIDRKIASFSMMGREYLELGFLSTLSRRDNNILRFARRIALNVQTILLGTDAAELPVELTQPANLSINMKTARAIGFSPNWRDLEAADLLFNDLTEKIESITLIEAMKRAVAANLDLQVSSINPELAANQVKSTRAGLLPQLNVGAGYSLINDERAGLQEAERSSDAELSLSQLVYSERVWSDFDVARLLKEAEDSAYQSRILDVMRDSATSYLQVLLSRATEQIRKSNLRVSQANLELARNRLAVGYSDRSDVLRWDSEIASDQSTVYQATASREQAETELKRQLNLPLNSLIKVTDEGVIELINVLDSVRFKRFFNTPQSFKVFTQFEFQRAVDNSPELSQVRAQIASSQRQLDAAKRIYYIPDVSVNVRYNKNISRNGVGASSPNLLDDDWSASLQASLPLFAGGARQAEVARAGNSLRQSQTQHQAQQQQIEASVLSAIQRAKGSYPAVRLARQAADAAKANFELITDAYVKGAISITNLIDAQDAALAANLAAVEAQYNFVIDWVAIQRAIANFDVLLTVNGFDQWYEALNSYYASNHNNNQNHVSH